MGRSLVLTGALHFMTKSEYDGIISRKRKVYAKYDFLGIDTAIKLKDLYQ